MCVEVTTTKDERDNLWDIPVFDAADCVSLGKCYVVNEVRS
jgi:hypothetical protein